MVAKNLLLRARVRNMSHYNVLIYKGKIGDLQDEDEDSDSEVLESKVAESLNKKIAQLKDESEKSIKGTRDELLRKYMQ